MRGGGPADTTSGLPTHVQYQSPVLRLVKQGEAARRPAAAAYAAARPPSHREQSEASRRSGASRCGAGHPAERRGRSWRGGAQQVHDRRGGRKVRDQVSPRESSAWAICTPQQQLRVSRTLRSSTPRREAGGGRDTAGASEPQRGSSGSLTDTPAPARVSAQGAGVSRPPGGEQADGRPPAAATAACPLGAKEGSEGRWCRWDGEREEGGWPLGASWEEGRDEGGRAATVCSACSRSRLSASARWVASSSSTRTL